MVISARAERFVVTCLVSGSGPVAYRDEVVAAYGGPVDVAHPGAVFEI